VLLFGCSTDSGWPTKLQEFSLSPERTRRQHRELQRRRQIGQFLALTAVFIGLSYWRTPSRFSPPRVRHQHVVDIGGFILVGYQLTGYAVTR